MKVLLLLMLVIPSAAMAQQTSPLIGDWRGDWSMTLNHADQLHKDKYQSADPDIRKRIEDGIVTRKFSFDADGTFSLNWRSASIIRNSSGAWSWNAGTNILTLTIKELSREYNVSFLDKNKIIIKVLGVPSTLIFDEIVLVRI